MEYSPYKRRSRSQFSRSPERRGNIFVFFLSALVGFSLFWGVKVIFFQDLGAVVLPSLQHNSSVVEVKLGGMEGWNVIRQDEESRVIAEGDSIRVQRGNASVLYVENALTAFLGLGSELFMEEIRKNSEEKIYGSIKMNDSPVLFSFQEGSFDTSRDLKIWVSPFVYVRALSGKIFVTSTSVDTVDAQTVEVVITDDEGKIVDIKEFGVGQSFNIKTKSIQAISEKSKYIPLYQEYIAPPSVVPEDVQVEEEDLPPNVKSPTITSPGDGEEIIEITTVPQTLLGSAPADARQIIVEHENEDGKIDPYVLKGFDGTQKEWKYIASPSYETIYPGKNIYRVYSVNEEGEKSEPAMLIMNYTPSKQSQQNIFTTAKGILKITSPNNGVNTSQSKRTIRLSGTAPSNASSVTVINSTLGTSYRLQKFSYGNTTWWYQTGEMDPGAYKYIVVAQNSKGKNISSDTITITIEGKVETPAVVSSAEVERAPASTPKPTPAVSATSEISR